MGNRLTDAVEKQLNRLKAYQQANTPRSTRTAVSPAHVIDQGLFDGNSNRLLQRAKAAPAELNALASPQMREQFNQVMANPPKPDKQQWFDAGMELSGMAPLGGLVAHTVYHGSPHKFDRFDMSKIGTGEGAQAYGHGLYFAESPDVANAYRSNLTYQSGEIPKVQGLEIGDYYNKISDKANRLPPAQAANEYDKLAMLEDLMGEQTTPQMVLDNAAMREYPAHAVEWFKKEILPNYDMPGAFYKVDIPDEAIPRMLDWDKPLSEQHPDVQAAFANAGVKANVTADDLFNELSTKYNWSDETARKYAEEQAYLLKGSHAYQEFANQEATKSGIDRVGHKINNNQAMALASERLRALGIPGIRYLDGNSRGAGGTSNFVLFDDQLPRILEVNGQPSGLLSYADEAAQKANPHAVGLNGKPIDPHGKVRKVVDNTEMGKSSPALTQEQIDSALDTSRWLDRGLKLNKAQKIYRGESERTGKNTANFGRGLYTTTDKAEAAQYGVVREMKAEDLPSNPIRFSDEGKFREWESHVGREVFGYSRGSEFNQAKGNVDEWLPTLDPTIDGIQIGTGKGAFFVKFPKR